MSYDIRLLILASDESISDVANREYAGPTVSSPESRARNAAIASAVKAKYPDLELFEGPDFIELSDISSGSGIQLSLSSQSGAFHVPYWHEDRASLVLGRLNDMLRIVLSTSNFVAFDPQTEKQLDANIGVGISEQKAYAAGVSVTRELAPKPWWKLW